MEPSQYEISCHCGANSQTLQGISGTWPHRKADGDGGISLCHCNTCRHTTGILCTSYLRICVPLLVEELRFYDSSPTVRRYFCDTCGCHIFYRHENGETFEWSVATGVISNCKQETTTNKPVSGSHNSKLRYARHVNVTSTKDGGLSPFLGEVGGDIILENPPETEVASLDNRPADVSPPAALGADSDETVQASCHCGTVRFHLTRPDNASRAPHSALADLLVPYKLDLPESKNVEDRKWWLRPEGASMPSKYLAGTCACKSCRLTSGFEIQTWAFVPRSNIIFHLPTADDEDVDQGSATSQTTTKFLPLDFAALPDGILRTYESSPGVLRESCVHCGATVFWHDRWHRPDLIDVSVGLLRSPAGARAENWLDWWRDRVSFSEDAELGRTGIVAAVAKDLVEALQTGLRENKIGRIRTSSALEQ